MKKHTSFRLRTGMAASAILAALALVGIGSAAQAAPDDPQLTIRYFVVTSPNSPSNTFSLQNAMDYMGKDGQVGFISTDVAHDPAALNPASVLRACDIIYGPASFPQWDATNNPAGSFAGQSGKRAAWIFDFRSPQPFTANQASFVIDSLEQAHALRYAGNVATNASNGQPLAFSSTLRGELWDGQGNVIGNYHNGEAIASHPINRLLFMVRVGYYCTDMAQVSEALNYFKNNMTMSLTAAFTLRDGSGNVVFQGTNMITSMPSVHPERGSGNRGFMRVEGQRQLPITYGLMRTLSLNPDEIDWMTVATGMKDGDVYEDPWHPMAFFVPIESLETHPVLSRPAASALPSFSAVGSVGDE